MRATLGGGCFWCLEPVFEGLRGVSEVVPGYAAGWDPDPTYRRVCSGETGHAEVVQVSFDPEVISFRQLLRVFFTVHDPTTPNRQGADVGSQYRSIILFHDADQERTAREVMQELEEEGVWEAPLVTEVVPFEAFHPAEEEHHDYFARNPEAAYCRVVVEPKVRKAREGFRELWRDAGAPGTDRSGASR